MKGKTNKGITLIALIITIVVMLILVGVVVSTTISSNLIEKVKSAVGLYKTKEGEDANIAGATIGGETYGSLQDYVSMIHRGYSSGGQENIVPTRNEPIVGDYVYYTPSGTAYETKYEVEQKYSGYSSKQDVYLQETRWRILDITEDGIELVSESGLYGGDSRGNTRSLYFQGATGYNNCVEILNDLCNELYGNESYAKGARSLNIEDIQKKVNPETDVTQKTFSGANAYYPARWTQEENAIVDDNSTGGTLGQSDEGNLIPWDETTNSEKVGITYFQKSTDSETITVTTTLKKFQQLPEILSGLIDSSCANTYLASRYAYNYVYGSTSKPEFGIYKNSWRSTENGREWGETSSEDLMQTYESGNIMRDTWAGIRPVVSLRENVSLVKDTKNTINGYVCWDLSNGA